MWIMRGEVNFFIYVKIKDGLEIILERVGFFFIRFLSMIALVNIVTG